MRVIEFFDRGVSLDPAAVAFVRHDGSEPMTYGQAQQMTHRIAAALHRDGLGEGDQVAVLSPNDPLVMPCVLGIMRAGCRWVALNATSSTDELAAMLTLVGARMLVYAPQAAGTARELAGRVPGLERLVALRPTGDGEPDLAQWMAPEGSRVELPPLDPEGVAAYFGTGGTTGRPKAVGLPHRALETMIHAFNMHLPERRPVNLVAAPLTHAAGAAAFPVLSLGGTTVIHDGVSPAAILKSIEEHRVTRLLLPPTAIYALLDHPDAGRRDTSSLRYFLYGAAPMSVARLEQAIKVFGPVMAQFYGQVEAPMMCAFFSPEDHTEALADPALHKRLASCGRPSLAANVGIMDDGGRLLGPGEHGEIVVRTSLRMAGYHDEPEQTAAVARPGGWHATGDIGYVDEDGFVYLVDRKRDVIISGGFNVFPSEVEQVIWSHPAVGDCSVIGLPDDKWGERVTAVVELKEGAAATEAEIVDLCRERLGSVKAPKQVVFRRLPRSEAGKVLKKTLRDEYWAGHDRRII